MMKWLWLVVVALVVAGCSSEPTPAEKAAQDPLAVWQPDLDAPIAELELLLESQSQQQNINRVAGQLAVLNDARLYQLYLRKLGGLEGESRQAFEKEQRDWLEERDRISRAAAEEFRGGSISPFIASQAFIDETRARYAALEARR
ncbi:MAG: lysozyme inhibitor LprI family protein [Alcanivoracaceae bacterium]